MARGKRCRAHRHVTIVAEENHHLQPQSRGGLTAAANMRYLCANAHSDTHYLLDLIEKQAKPLIGTGAHPQDPPAMVPWPVLRTYGIGIRDAALTGWSMYGAAFLRGDFVRHAALWLSSGVPTARPRRTDRGGNLYSVPPYSVAREQGEVDRWLDFAAVLLDSQGSAAS